MHEHVLTLAKVCETAGIKHAVICPGSRSAPLVYAFTQYTNIRCHSVVDERSAGFVALGLAQQSNVPVILIATSGSACLNFFPAVAEAFYQKIPLLILTADRPPELLNQQDGQMIMQKEVYGKHVIASHELLCYDENTTYDELTERIVKSALLECIGSEKFGPVHINVPLREPLYDLPKMVDFSPIKPISLEAKNRIKKMPLLAELSEAWAHSKKRLIIIGQMPPNRQMSAHLQKLTDQDDVVILGDIVSNQLSVCSVPHFDAILQFGNKSILTELEPDFVLSIGGSLVSKALKNWLKKQQPRYHFRLQSETDIMVNTYQNLTHEIITDVEPYLHTFQSLRIFKNKEHKPYTALWITQEDQLLTALHTHIQHTNWSEPKAMKMVLSQLPANAQVQLGNSSSVRWASWLSIPHPTQTFFSNRGTSGIDGSLSTAIGAAMAKSSELVTLIIGDLSIFYDQNGFWQQMLPANLKIIVLNNQGGNIFNWIEGPKKFPNELRYFTTPHQLSISKMCSQYGIKHQLCTDEHQLLSQLHELYAPSNQPVLLELAFQEQDNLLAIDAFKKLRF
jgi:2-succinyl-5-enolpyruvyl-6-hydroxy-3-cyclohexene-1-carboxylate synthase